MIPPARRLAAAALSGALLMLSALTGTAHATPADVTFSVPMAKSEADMKKVAEYWKPERLKQADNYTPATPGTNKAAAPASTASASASASRPAGAAGSRLVAAKRLPARDVQPAAPKNGGAAKTMGKVFFRIGDKEFWCSAASVASKGHNLVATAGHCAWDVRQEKAGQYWIFVPNPAADGSTPEGIYVGRTLSLHEQWSGAGDYDYDYAFVSVHRGFRWVTKDGALTMQDVGNLQDNVGGLGLTVDRKTGNSIDAFGYPAGSQPDGSRPYDGRTLRTCEGLTKRTVSPSYELEYGVLLEKCDFSAGASGGPWVLRFATATKLGYLNGINSLTWNRDAAGRYDAISSPYFVPATLQVYQRAEAGASS